MTLPRRLGWALLIGAVAAVVAVTAGADRWLAAGRPGQLVFEVETPTPVTGAADDPIARAWRTRLPGFALAITPTADPRLVMVTVDGQREAADRAGSLLQRRGRLVFTVVVSDTPVARRWYQRTQDGAAGADVQAEADVWQIERTGVSVNDYFLRASTRDALDRAFEQLVVEDPLPDGLTVVYELVEPSAPDRGRRYFRTHIVEATPRLDGHDIASASVDFDQNTQRPEVVLRFSKAGARRFAETTGGMIGSKLAIILDDLVVSAPIIQGQVGGGVATIAMGGASIESAERDAATLVAALRSRAELPAGIRATLGEVRPGKAGLPWLAPLLLAFFAAALSFVGIARLAPWIAPGPRLAAGSRGLFGTVAAAALTLGLPLVLVWLPELIDLWLPGGNGEEMARILGYGQDSGFGAGMAQISVFALGVLPVISGFWMVEVIAAVSPRWRQRRLGGVGDRQGLDRAALVVGFVLAAIQAFFIAQYLDSVSGSSASVFDGNTAAHATLIVTAVAGVAVHVVVANLVTRRGLCNGYLALLGISTARRLLDLFATTPSLGVVDHRLLVFAAMVALVVVMVFLTGLRDRGWAGTRQPGPWLPAILGLGEAIGLITLLVMIFAVIARAELGSDWLTTIATRPLWFDALFSAVAIAAVARWQRVAMTQLAVATAAVLLVTVIGLRWLMPTGLAIAAIILPTAYVGFFVVELAVAFRARLGLRSPTVVLAVHDVDRADRAADALTAVGIAASVEGLRARAILRGFAAYLPIIIRVAAADAERATAVIAAAEADHDPGVAAFAA